MIRHTKNSLKLTAVLTWRYKVWTCSTTCVTVHQVEVEEKFKSGSSVLYLSTSALTTPRSLCPLLFMLHLAPSHLSVTWFLPFCSQIIEQLELSFPLRWVPPPSPSPSPSPLPQCPLPCLHVTRLFLPVQTLHLLVSQGRFLVFRKVKHFHVFL